MATADRLSKLPDGILLDIISRLWTDEMVRTSVLSSRWRRLWTASPVLDFTRAFPRARPEHKDYPGIVHHCLRQCSASHKLRSARFPLRKDPGFAAVVDRWIRFAASMDVEDLSLTAVFLFVGRVEVRSSLFDCRLLSTLKLKGCSIPSGFHGFPCLRTLAFTHVTITNDAMEALLSASPRIEHLSLSLVDHMSRLVIRAPAMRHLMVYACDGLDRVEIVHAPELRRLMYSGGLSIIRSVEGVAPKLDDAVLLSSDSKTCDFSHLHPWRHLVSFIFHARVLSLNSWLFEFTLVQDYGIGDRHPMFENLQELHWWPMFKESPGLPEDPWRAEELSDSLRALASFFRHCPSLEQVCILCTYYLKKEADEMSGLEEYDDLDDSSQSSDDDDKDDPLQEFEGVGYVLPRLKTVRMLDFTGKKEEMRLVEFFADKAVALESMTLHYVGELDLKLEKIRQRLHAFRRASPVARILVSEFDRTRGKVCPKHDDMWSEFMVM